MTDESDIAVAPEQPARGSLGGWLVLVLLWLIAVPSMELTNAMRSWSIAFALVPTMAVLPAVLLSTQVVINSLLGVVFPVLLMVLMLSYKRSFPRYFIMWVVASALFTAVNIGIGYWSAQQSAERAANWHLSQFAHALLFTGIALVVWVPYMLRSKRVKTTFTH